MIKILIPQMYLKTTQLKFHVFQWSMSLRLAWYFCCQMFEKPGRGLCSETSMKVIRVGWYMVRLPSFTVHISAISKTSTLAQYYICHNTVDRVGWSQANLVSLIWIHCTPYDGLSIDQLICQNAWWHHQMETLSALLALRAGNSTVTGEFLSQRPVMRSINIFFGLRLNKRVE